MRPGSGTGLWCGDLIFPLARDRTGTALVCLLNAETSQRRHDASVPCATNTTSTRCSKQVAMLPSADQVWLLWSGVTGLLAEKEVPLLLRLSVAHRQDGFTPGVSAFVCSPGLPVTKRVFAQRLGLSCYKNTGRLYHSCSPGLPVIKRAFAQRLGLSRYKNTGRRYHSCQPVVPQKLRGGGWHFRRSSGDGTPFCWRDHS